MGSFRIFAGLTAACVCLGQNAADIRVDVNLVTVACSVSDRNGAPVANLHKEDFTLLDAGAPRDIRYFWQETDLPLTVGLIADVSGSQIGVIRKHRDTITKFLAQVIGPQDRAFLVTVGPEVKLITDLTSSIDQLRAGVDQIQSRTKAGVQFGEPCRGPGALPRQQRRIRSKIIPGCGGTALWNGVYAAAKLKMQHAAGRKALIVLSDGIDTGSFHSLSDAIEAAQSADTLVYTMRAVSPVLMTLSPLMAVRGVSGMRRVAEETGGQAFPSPKDPAAVFTQIENELRNLYVLGFTPPEDARDRKFHPLTVKTAQSGAIVRARKGYTAN